MNPYCIFDLHRPHRQPRHHQGNQGRSAFPVTRTGAGVDLPGVGRRDMSDQEDTPTAQAARGGSSSRGASARRDDDRGRPWNLHDFIPADDPGWARCTVKTHEDFPRHIFCLFLLLGIQFRWLLTRGNLAVLSSLRRRPLMMMLKNCQRRTFRGLEIRDLEILGMGSWT